MNAGMLLAQAAPQGGAGSMGMLIPMVLVFGIFYFMILIRVHSATSHCLHQ